MGELISTSHLKKIILKKIYKPCGISLQLIGKLTPHNRQVIVDWTRLELMRKENIAAEDRHIKEVLKNIN